MKLGRAYETLKDESKRRAYDLIYPGIRRSSPFPQPTQTPRPPPASPSQPEALNEAAQIDALQKSKQERGARWGTKKNALSSSIFELQRNIRRLEQEIKNLNSVVAAEAATEAQKNSWGTWFLSPIYRKAEDSEEEKERKDRERQERKIEKDMKERRLELKKAELRKQEGLLIRAKEDVDAADMVENGKIRVLQQRIWARETKERQDREKTERDRLARIWKQQQEQREKRDREAAEALRRQHEEEQKRYEERTRASRQAYTSTCRHDGWWPKVQGRTACPECDEIWTYLLQCPRCSMKACPKCQSAIRRTRNATRPVRGNPSRVRTPSPTFYYDYD